MWKFGIKYQHVESSNVVKYVTINIGKQNWLNIKKKIQQTLIDTF